MKHVYWLKPGSVAGRTGPDNDAWDLDEIKANGFAAILSVNDGEAVHVSRLASLGIEYANIPMSPNAPARPGDRELCLENLPRAMAFIRGNLPNGPVLVHCHSGKDRTGLVLAAWLIEFEGYLARAAMQRILEIRPIAFSAEQYMDFALDVLKRFENNLVAGDRQG